MNYIDFLLNAMKVKTVKRTGWMSADYISKSNVGNPPPKPKKKQVLERIKDSIEGLVPQLLPQPVKVYNYVIYKK